MKNAITRSLAGSASAVLVALTLGACASDEPQAQVMPPVTVSETAPCCGPITPAAQKILKVLDDSNVEHLWAKHHHVNWDTGIPDEPADYKGHDAETHCSDFAAAIGKRLNVYMLRPPDHSQHLLASAQTEWFGGVLGSRAGWYKVDTPEQAQALANQGKLVVISYASPNPKKPGHIAIVRPSLITGAAMREHGPDIAQAGEHNYLSGTAKLAFKWHPGAWPNGVKYFAHDVPAQ